MAVTPAELAVVAIDQMLGLVHAAHDQRHPIEWLEDRLLDMRLEVTTP